MRVAFAGTPPFAARALEALVAAGHDVALVLTQPDRPAGRGMRLSASAVAQAAARHGLAVEKPLSLKEPEARESLQTARIEVMVVAAYGLILPQAVLDTPKRGCINIHASLLPRWRGAAPIHRAILAGDSTTGISIMRMDAGLDTGPVLLTRAIPVAPRETTATLTARLAEQGAEAIVQALSSLDELTAQPQDNSRATYAAKVSRTEARIDWTMSSEAIDRQIRAFDPFPGAETTLDDESLKVWQARPVSGSGSPGEILEAAGGRLVVACGEGALDLEIIQRAGARRLPAAEFLRGNRLTAGMTLPGLPVSP